MSSCRGSCKKHPSEKSGCSSTNCHHHNNNKSSSDEQRPDDEPGTSDEPEPSTSTGVRDSVAPTSKSSDTQEKEVFNWDEMVASKVRKRLDKRQRYENILNTVKKSGDEKTTTKRMWAYRKFLQKEIERIDEELKFWSEDVVSKGPDEHKHSGEELTDTRHRGLGLGIKRFKQLLDCLPEDEEDSTTSTSSPDAMIKGQVNPVTWGEYVQAKLKKRVEKKVSLENWLLQLQTSGKEDNHTWAFKRFLQREQERTEAEIELWSEEGFPDDMKLKLLGLHQSGKGSISNLHFDRNKSDASMLIEYQRRIDMLTQANRAKRHFWNNCASCFKHICGISKNKVNHDE